MKNGLFEMVFVCAGALCMTIFFYKFDFPEAGFISAIFFLFLSLGTIAAYFQDHTKKK